MTSQTLAMHAARLWPRGRALTRRFLAAAGLARSRRDLARLDDHLLHDVGLTRSEAEAEARRPSWDAPLHWHR